MVYKYGPGKKVYFQFIIPNDIRVTKLLPPD